MTTSGKEKILINTVVSWVGQLVFIISGFILPRLIDNFIGQQMLGIWDMSWSFVNYISLTQFGIGSSINRYVSKYRTTGDISKLNTMVSTVYIIQFCIGLLAAVVIISLVVSLPTMFSHKLGAKVEDAQYVLLFLGLGLVAQIALETSRGILTGYHKWILHNVIMSGSQALILILIIITLSLGGTIRNVALIYGVVMFFSSIIRTIIVFSIIPELKLSFRAFDLAVGKKMFKFGIKTFLIGLSPILLLQTTSLIIAYKLSPSVLAVFSRPIALMRHLETFVNKFAYILTPTVSSLQSTHDHNEISKFVIKSSKYTLAMALPVVTFLVVHGDLLMLVWMGENYVHTRLIIILALGYLLPVSQVSAVRIMIGLNNHGSLSYKLFLLSTAIYAIFLLFGGMFGWSLTYMATALVVSLAIGNGVVVVNEICGYLKISAYEYFKKILFEPLICNFLFAAVLLILKLTIKAQPVVDLLLGGIVGGIVLVVMYSFFYKKDKVIDADN